MVIFSSACENNPWDHVSVSVWDRTPHLAEMSFVQKLFWPDADLGVQARVPCAHVYPHCRHLWKHVNPLPPAEDA